MTPLYVGISHNPKTGNIPQQFIGKTRKESLNSCEGCALLKSKDCYSHYGMSAVGHGMMIKALTNGKDYSLENALKIRHKGARYVRFGAIGDPAAISKALLYKHEKKIRAFGLGIINYTHFWATRGSHLIRRAMASADTFNEAVTAVKKGWRSAVWVEKDFIKKYGNKGKYKGVKWAQCPYQTHGTQCNKCGLCDASKTYLIPIIVFEKH